MSRLQGHADDRWRVHTFLASFRRCVADASVGDGRRSRDRAGNFVLETVGDVDGKIASWTATVVPGSGTRDLSDLSGEGTFAAPMGSTAEFEMHLNV
ncbi:MAG TPA: DUF3224 domain-containing protein [Acidimicrobiia bacterium]|nr:DUF3224 domain-containing protein [Acidimicrobiia bacterium]